MRNPVASASLAAREAVDLAIRKAAALASLPECEIPGYTIDVPNESSHGDLAANVALAGARAFKLPPRAAADIIAANIELPGLFDRVEVAGPGFINFFFSRGYYSAVIGSVLELDDRYGHTDYGQGKRVIVEFVSANPTGPMHLGNARGGVLGDCIAAALETCGHAVSREFYVNDAGNQIDRFAFSLEARYLALYKEGVPFPDDGYHGGDIAELAREFARENADAFVDAPGSERRGALVAFALPKNIASMRAALRQYRIDYDAWFLESSLHSSGAVKRTMDTLSEKGLTYQKEGALWYRASDFGCDKDEVLIKSNGFYTYFAVDIAYHYDKLVTRGFNLAINVWGADHHGHVARIKGAMDALGVGGDRLEIVLMQLVNLLRDGEPVRMSKRTGQAITLTDLLEEIPVDAARFYFNLREYSSHFDFDLGLAVRQSSDNPVYYVQYAHARICSIIRALAAEGISPPSGIGEFDPGLLRAADELALIRRIGMFPGEIISAAREREPSRINRYAIDLATAFHRFYTNCRVMVDDRPLRAARLALCEAARRTLRNCLGLLRISAPESM
jgi:arginyl-tRNA synthetase